ncbi:MAG TPA: hypothetical protein PK951_11835 [Chitinophagaceae bacterium]|nr:hypothetical protein [Chitinophagaceae bacterium]
MKKTALFLLTLVLAVIVKAQSYDDIKSYLLLGQTKKAKEDINKRMTNSKFASKPEAFILKAAVYSALAADSAVQNTPEAENYRSESEAAFKKYQEMEPSGELMKDPVYQNAPVRIYSNLFGVGYKQYEEKKWAEAFETFKKVDGYSSILSQQKLLNSNLDTNVVILAGITAESSNQKDEAAKYYSRLADAKLAGTNYESIYRFLVTHYFTKKDMNNFEKYKALGKELYPQSEFFTYDKTDFAVGLESDFNSKLKSLEEVLAKDPKDYKANLSIGQVIYDTLNSKVEGAVPPANAEELEKRMVAAFNAAGEAKPDEQLPYLVIGDYFVMLKAEGLKKTDKKYAEYLEAGREPYEKAAAIFEKKGLANLNGSDKQQYKKAAGFLEDIYNFKKEQAKGKPAEVAKYTAEAKKWGDLYSSIR